MKKSLLILSVLVLGWSTGAQAQLITGFGSSAVNPVNLATDLNGQWSTTGSQTATSLTVTGASNDIGTSNGIGTVAGVTLASPKSIVGNTGHLSLTGTLNTAVPTVNSFSITLYDSSFDSLGYNFTWSSFAGGGANGVAVVSSLASSSGTFNGTVAYWKLGLFGSGNEAAPTTVGFTFDDLAAVAAPEPSTYAMLGLGLGFLGLCLYRRSSKTAARIRA